MREPLYWSFPVGRVFGANVRVHVMLPLVMFGLIAKVVLDKNAPPDIGWAAGAVAGIAFLSILLHEFGHVFAARSVGGECEEVLLWPLGGLAFCDVPHTPRANLLTTLGGPSVNLAICFWSAALLATHTVWPPLNPFTSNVFYPSLVSWISGEEVSSVWYLTLAARMFAINWILFWFNLIPAFPLDGGQALQAILWSRGDYRDALTTAAYVGFGAMLILCVVAVARESVLMFALAILIYVHCRGQLIQGDATNEDGPLGYDFSQGYASLERGAAAPAHKSRPNFMKRWSQRRAARRAHEEQAAREAEEQRMDQLLEKVQQSGLTALTEEERRFLSRVSARYRGK